MRQPEFLTPVAQAQETGLELYWLGAEFTADDAVFQISGNTQLIERDGAPPGLVWYYGMRKPAGGAEAIVQVHADGGGGDEAAREALKRVRGATSKSVQVGPWEGLLYSLPAGTRPVNQYWLFVDVGATVAIVRVPSGDTGIPGQDSNPLLDPELLIDVVVENLRPYPD